MKKTFFLLLILFLLGAISCSTTKSSSTTKTVSETDAPDKTTINYSRTISASQARQIAQLFKAELADFPDDSFPIKYENNTKYSLLNIYLKKNKVKLNYRSKYDVEAEQQEAVKIHQLKEKIAAL